MKKIIGLVLFACLIGASAMLLLGNSASKPLMKNEQKVGEIDLDEEDPILSTSYKDLIEARSELAEESKEDKPYIIAQVVSKDDKDKEYTHYFDADALNQWLFKDGGYKEHEYESIERYKNLFNNMPIIRLEYFKINKLNDPAFNYLCSFNDLAQDTKNDANIAWRDYFSEQCPIEEEVGADAQELYDRGYTYLYGDEDAGIPQDYARALRLFERVSQQGENQVAQADAYGSLSMMYEEGLGVTKNQDTANQYYRREREILEEIVQDVDNPEDAGHAAVRLGSVYQRGLGTDPDREKAIDYYEKALNIVMDLEPEDAHSIRDVARFNLGMLYCDPGANGYPDYAQASHYFTLIVEDPETQDVGKVLPLYELVKIYLRGGGGIEKNYAKVRDYVTQLIQNPAVTDLQRVGSYYALSKIYFEGGYGVEKDYAKVNQYCNQIIQNNAASEEYRRDAHQLLAAIQS